MVNQTPLELAPQDGLFMRYKYAHTSPFEGIDNARAEINDLVVSIGIVCIAATQLLRLLSVEEGQEEFHRLRIGE